MDGILPVYKETGMTSHDVVFKLRKILHTKKIGHAGTLDPSVDGVLPIAIGKATKTIEFLQMGGKTYTGSVTFGFSTTTEDLDGEIVSYDPLKTPFTEDEIAAAMADLEGDIIQIPPMFSAVKVNGRRLYDYARAGETVERPKRQATIFHFKRTSEILFDEEKGLQTFNFEAKVSKGTYIRTLAVDLGEALGVPAVMSQLTRQSAGGFELAESHSLADIAEKMAEEETLGDWLAPLSQAVAQYPTVELDAETWAKAQNGVGFGREVDDTQAERLVVTFEGDVKSVYTWSDSKQLYRPYRTFKIN